MKNQDHKLYDLGEIKNEMCKLLVQSDEKVNMERK